MKKYCLAFCFVLATLTTQGQAQQIYKWTDSNGNIHFSDKPHEGAEEIALPKVQTFSAPKISEPANASVPTPISDDETYKSINIIQPEDQSTLRNTQGYVSILLNIKPTLKEGDRVQIVLDGAPVGEPQPATVFALQDIKRGSHTLSAQLVDKQGHIIKTSTPITIFMMPPRVGMGKNNH